MLIIDKQWNVLWGSMYWHMLSKNAKSGGIAQLKHCICDHWWMVCRLFHLNLRGKLVFLFCLTKCLKEVPWGKKLYYSLEFLKPWCIMSGKMYWLVICPLDILKKTFSMEKIWSRLAIGKPMAHFFDWCERAYWRM